jgi:SAM-dependent methyltransferase
VGGDEPDDWGAHARTVGGDEPDDWEAHAGWWIEHFTAGADPEYVEQILPLAAAELAGARHVLDVGCGEGQVARLAAGGGALVTGIDAARNQLIVAIERAGGPRYLQASATALPVADAAVDAVVACLVFEHIEALDRAMAEVARVLAPGGRFCLFLNHPILQAPGSGWIDDHTVVPPERYWRLGPYLVESVTDELVERDVRIRFVHRPLARYVNAAAGHGMFVERMLEPAPPEGYLARIGDREQAPYPRLLYLRLRRAEHPAAGGSRMASIAPR